MPDPLTVTDLWRTPPTDVVPAPLEADPSTDPSALDEAQLLDVRFDAVNGIVGVLLEMRMSLYFDEGDTALLTARGVSSLDLRVDVAPHRLVREFGDVVVERLGDRVRLTFGGRDGPVLTLVAERLDLWLLDVDGISAAPPDYGDDEVTVQAGLPQWTSTCRVLQGGRLLGHPAGTP